VGSFKHEAIKILRKSTHPLHYKEITKIAIEKGLIETSGETPEMTMNAQITRDIKYKKEKSAFKKTKPGFFTINPNYTEEEQKIEEKFDEIESEETEVETKRTQYIGKAGEHLVISKLLFLGCNANTMVVDEGVDIVATKDERLYNIQVKTANEKYGKYVSDMNISSYQKNNPTNTYFIFVLRGKDTNFLILPYVEVQKNIDQKNILVVGHNKRYRINITKKDENLYLGNLQNKVTYFKNNWNFLK